MEEEEVMQVVHGHVKWFDPSKGFGFIVSDQTDADILLHANVLRNFGQGSVADGAGIEVRVQRTQRGVQAVEVLRIDPPEGVVLPFGEDAAEMVSADILALALEPARVQRHRQDEVDVRTEVLRTRGQRRTEERRHRQAVPVLERMHHGIDRKHEVVQRERGVVGRLFALAGSAAPAVEPGQTATGTGARRTIRKRTRAGFAHRVACGFCTAHKTVLRHENVRKVQPQRVKGTRGI